MSVSVFSGETSAGEFPYPDMGRGGEGGGVAADYRHGTNMGISHAMSGSNPAGHSRPRGRLAISSWRVEVERQFLMQNPLPQVAECETDSTAVKLQPDTTERPCH